MQNVKKNNVGLGLVFSVLIGHSSYAKEEWKGMGGIGMEKVANSVNNLSGSVDGLKTTAPTIGENAGKEVKEGATKIAEAITLAALVAGGAAVGYGLGHVIYYTYKEVKSGVKTTARVCCPKWFTSTEEQLHEKEVSNRLKLLEAKEELTISLITHAYEAKNCTGIPCASEDAARKYASVAGIKALDEVVEEFRQAYRSKSFLTGFYA